MTAVTILHISDLHERAPFDDMPAGRAARLEWDAEERAKLLGPCFRAALAEFAGKVDLVCLTGDVVDWGHPAEYAAATTRVTDILAAVDVPLDRFFAVPGNHDVQRRVEEDAWRTIRAWHASARDTGALGRWFRQASEPPFGLDDGIRARVLHRTAAFWDWMDLLGRGELRPVAPKLLGFRSTIECVHTSGLPVHIVGMDSAWLCGGDDDQGRIVVTAEQAQAHLFDRGEKLRGLRIALVHHPLEHLADGHEVRRVLADAGTDLLLHGHQHMVTSLRTDEQDAHLRILAAGCLVEGDHGHRWPNGFQVIELDVAQRSGRVSFRKWSQDGRFWAKGCDVYRDAPDGTLEWYHEHVEDHAKPRAPAQPALGRLKVLLVSCGPTAKSSVGVDEEMQTIASILRTSNFRDRIILIPGLAARLDDLLQLLNEHEPDVVHFAGHVSSKELAFMAEDGTATPNTGTALAQLFETKKKRPKIVMLNDYFTHHLANAITKQVDIAIGMTGAITHKGAIVFAASFYRAIGLGKSITESVAQGKTALLLEGIADAVAVIEVTIKGHLDGGPINKGDWRPLSLERILAANRAERPRRSRRRRSKPPTSSNRSSETSANAVDSLASQGTAEPFVVISGTESIHEDELVDILNRKSYAARTTSVVFCDIDGLLGINKKHGVLAGNEVVRQSVNALMECAGAANIYRVRGDQFVIILLERDLNDALLLARQCSERIAIIPWSLVAPDLYMSCTFSVARYIKSMETAAHCLLRLVLAAKASKTRGQGNVVVAPEYCSWTEGLSDEEITRSLSRSFS